MTKPRSKKQKTEKEEKKFDIHSSQFFLTYSKYELTKKRILEHLTKIINKKTDEKKYYISNYIIASEFHEDETSHLHTYLKLEKKISYKTRCYVRDDHNH